MSNIQIDISFLTIFYNNATNYDKLQDIGLQFRTVLSDKAIT